MSSTWAIFRAGKDDPSQCELICRECGAKVYTSRIWEVFDEHHVCPSCGYEGLSEENAEYLCDLCGWMDYENYGKIPDDEVCCVNILPISSSPKKIPIGSECEFFMPVSKWIERWTKPLHDVAR